MISRFKQVLSVNWIKTFYINYYYFGFKGLLRLPILMGYGVNINSLGSKDAFVLEDSTPLNFARVCFCLKGGPYNMGDNKSLWHIESGAKFHIGKSLRFSKGTMLSILNNATLFIGNDFSSNANLYIQCAKSISIGNDVLLGWNNVIMDSDGGHMITDLEGDEILNPHQNITIGNHVWLGEGSSVLKGTFIPDGCVVASNAVATRVYDRPNAIIAGIPGKIIKENVNWNH